MLSGVGAALHRGRILVVDDVVDSLERLRDELEAEDFEVAIAATTDSCLELAAAWEPAVVILAVQSHELDAIDTCHRLKRNTTTRHIPVLFVVEAGAPDGEVIEALAAGGNDCLQRPYASAVMRARVSSQVAIYEAHERLRRMAMTDELTGLSSRRFLFESMPDHLGRLEQSSLSGLACLMIDVDNFKRVNDSLGHLEGDRVLRRVSGVIRDATRDSDIVARFGGEEIAVILPGIDADGATRVAEKVRAAVETRTKNHGHRVTVSIGVAWIDDPASLQSTRFLSWDLLMDGLFRRADEALYCAKEAGRNAVRSQAWGRPTPLPAALQTTGHTVRRRHRRLGVPVEVVVRGSIGSMTRTTADLSRGGLCLPGAYGLAEGEAVAVKLSIDETEVDATGVVVWRGGAPGHGTRCGIAFESFQGDGAERLDRFLARASEVETARASQARASSRKASSPPSMVRSSTQYAMRK